MAGQGNATVDFGSSPTMAEKSVAVTGQTGILATSQIEAFIQATDTTADHSADEHAAEDFQVWATDLVVGTGFTVWLRPRQGPVMKTYKVEWVWI